MEENLRLACLAAMDIPVWLSRSAPERVPADVASAQERAPAESAAPGALGKLIAAVATPIAIVRQSTARLALPIESRQEAVSLVFATAGSVLFVDEGVSREQRGLSTALLTAIAFALTRNKSPADLQDFAWPPRGVSANAEQTRDVVMGRLRKLLQERECTRIVLMGYTPTALLLGWSEKTFAARAGALENITGMEQPAGVTLSSAELLAAPLRKREAWRDLRAAVLP